MQASELAVRQGVKVYTIGAGRTGWAPVPVQLPSGSVGLRRAFVEIDEETLREIAERTQARYFRADDAEALGEVIEEIDRLERSEINEVRYLEYEPHYAVFVIGAIAFMLASSLLSGSWLRRLP